MQIAVPEAIRLPRTDTRRGANGSLTLVQRVDLNPNIPGGLAWHGRRYRPGARIPFPELIVDCEQRPPLILECTDAINPENKGVRRLWTLLEILWKYDSKSGDWVEVARVYSPCSYAGYELRQLAARLLKQDVWRELETVEDSAGRIHEFLQEEIRMLGAGRAPVIEFVLRYLVARLVDERGSFDMPRTRALMESAGRRAANV